MVVRPSPGASDFVKTLDQAWARHDVTNLLRFVEASAATNPCPETLSAKGIVYHLAIFRFHTATNLFWEAVGLARDSDNPRYSEKDVADMGICVRSLSRNLLRIVGPNGMAAEEVPGTNVSYIRLRKRLDRRAFARR